MRSSLTRCRRDRTGLCRLQSDGFTEDGESQQTADDDHQDMPIEHVLTRTTRNPARHFRRVGDGSALRQEFTGIQEAPHQIFKGFIARTDIANVIQRRLPFAI